MKLPSQLPHLGLFGRLFLLFSSTTIILAVFIALGVFTMSEYEAKSIVSKRHDNIVKMFKGVLYEMDDMEEIKKEARSNRVNLLIIKNGERWTTSDDFPDIKTLMQHPEAIGLLHFAKYNAKYYLLFNHENDWIVATALAANIIVYPSWAVYWPWLVVIVTLLLSYWGLRKLLKPVNEAIESTKRISMGDFDHRIESHSKTELALLTKGLNNMASDLKHLFEAQNELLLAISHELRTPMARMRVSLGMLEKSDVVEDLSQDITQMNLLIEQLLEGERLQQGSKVLSISTYFLPSLIDELISEPGMGDHIILINDAPEVAVDIDVGRIKFLLRNLLQNAIKHSGTSAKVQLKIWRESNGIRFDVIDAGIGIPDVSLDKIFDPFYCVEHINNRSTKGTGLGLYLCQQIAKAHKGKLSVKNNDSKGCTFTFLIPERYNEESLIVGY